MPESNKSQQGSFLLSSPIGFFIGQIKNGSLVTLQRQEERPNKSPKETELGQHIRRSLENYFSGKKAPWDFTFVLPGSPIEQKVYIALMKIPYGKTLPYSDIAQAVGRPFAARWVGNVIAKNPLPIIIPCHRVVRKSGIGEYSAGGEGAKRWLIRWEMLQVSEEYTPPSL